MSAGHLLYPVCLQVLLSLGRTACSLWGHATSTGEPPVPAAESKREAAGTERSVQSGHGRDEAPGARCEAEGQEGVCGSEGGGSGSWEGPMCKA